MEHSEVITLEKEGKLLIGVDRPMARKFYTDVPVSKIKEETDEAPYFDKIIVWFAFLCGPIMLIASIVIAFFAFRWWGAISIIICPIIFLIYSSYSVRGDSRMIGINAILIMTALVHFLNIFDNPWITGFATTFIFSLWCAHFLYCSSTFLLRSFIIRNEKAFIFLKDYLVIRSS